MSAAAIIESEGPIADDGRTDGGKRTSERPGEREGGERYLRKSSAAAASIRSLQLTLNCSYVQQLEATAGATTASCGD